MGGGRYGGTAEADIGRIDHTETGGTTPIEARSSGEYYTDLPCPIKPKKKIEFKSTGC